MKPRTIQRIAAAIGAVVVVLASFHLFSTDQATTISAAVAAWAAIWQASDKPAEDQKPGEPG